MIDDPLRRQLCARVHAHVEGSLAAEAESAIGGVELCARDSEVEEDRVRGIEARFLRDVDKVAEASLNNCDRRPERSQRHQAGLHRGGIAVDPEQPAARCDPLQDLAGVARLPHGAVDRDCPRLGLKQLYYLL